MKSVKEIEAEFWVAFHEGLSVYEGRPWEVPEQWRERCRALYDERLEALERQAELEEAGGAASGERFVA